MVEKRGLKVSSTLLELINNEVIPGTNLDVDNFWSKFSEVVHELSPINQALIKKRELIQKKIDDWHKSKKGKEFDKTEYIDFLKSFSFSIRYSIDFKKFIYSSLLKSLPLLDTCQ